MNYNRRRYLFLLYFLIVASCNPNAIFIPNYNESRIPHYKLPDPLVFENGDTVTDKTKWQERREEIYNIFEKKIYGVAPEWNGFITATTIFEDDDAFDGMAVTKEIQLTLHNEERTLDLYLLIHLPKFNQPAPVFLGANFLGNHTTSSDPNIRITSSWVKDNPAFFIYNNKATEESRGIRVHRWPVEEIIKRGYGLATFYYGDIDPDFDDGFENGVHGLMDKWHRDRSWGSVAAWAWGLSRVMDYLETSDQVDSENVFVMGHSRLGRAALWAGASDERFAMVIANNSGCVGAALSRRRIGETVQRINKRFPHWFAENFKKYNNREHRLPVDQHQLLALIAPRPLYLATAENDRWSDPRGEFISGVAATPVYELYNLKGLTATEFPAVNQPIHNAIGFHIRSGGHDITLYDWQQFLNFADVHFSKKITHFY